MKSIDKFQGDTRWLSNFWVLNDEYVDSEVYELVGRAIDSEGYHCYTKYRYPTTEHAYQAMKIGDPVERKKMIDDNDYMELPPGQVKKMSRSFKMRKDWDSIKLDVMYDLQKWKFQRGNNKVLRSQLLKTANFNKVKLTQESFDDIENFMYLTEGNTWGDRFWGCSPHGENHLGKIIMQVRNELLMESPSPILVGSLLNYPSWQDWDYRKVKPVLEK